MSVTPGLGAMASPSSIGVRFGAKNCPITMVVPPGCTGAGGEGTVGGATT